MIKSNSLGTRETRKFRQSVLSYMWSNIWIFWRKWQSVKVIIRKTIVMTTEFQRVYPPNQFLLWMRCLGEMGIQNMQLKHMEIAFRWGSPILWTSMGPSVGMKNGSLWFCSRRCSSCSQSCRMLWILRYVNYGSRNSRSLGRVKSSYGTL